MAQLDYNQIGTPLDAFSSAAAASSPSAVGFPVFWAVVFRRVLGDFLNALLAALFVGPLRFLQSPVEHFQTRFVAGPFSVEFSQWRFLAPCLRIQKFRSRRPALSVKSDCTSPRKSAFCVAVIRDLWLRCSYSGLRPSASNCRLHSVGGSRGR
jgi:hypothetical protein